MEELEKLRERANKISSMSKDKELAEKLELIEEFTEAAATLDSNLSQRAQSSE